MIPILYEHNEASWQTGGLGPLSDAISCTVTEESNGGFELEMKYPTSGKLFKELQTRRQILAAPNPHAQTQPFRIYRISKELRGAVTVNARHISYDLSGVVVQPFTGNDKATSAATAMAKLKSNSITANPFAFSTTIPDPADPVVMENDEPTSLRSLLGPAETEGTLLEIYGGDLEYDRLDVKLLPSRGADRGYRIEYGVNMVEMQHEEDASEQWSGIIPYWHSNDDTLVGDLCQPSPALSFTNVKAVDLSSEFNAKPTKSELNQHGADYVARQGIGAPETTITLEIVPPNSRGLHSLEDLRLFDEVTVRHVKLGIDVKKNVVKTVYNVLLDRYISVEVGQRKRFIAETIAAPIGSKKSAGGGGGGGGSKKTGLSQGSVTEKQLKKDSVKTEHIVDKAVFKAKIADLAVGYSQTDTETQGTLTQVGVNKADIETINGYFTGTANFSYLIASVASIGALAIGSASIYCSDPDGYVRYV